ncbi:MAG: hypothetical protein OEY58_14045, partial [Gammaproteobacteria bacterium]|nr:hypothetical protein [Gammaproteobacteria bacterium]
ITVGDDGLMSDGSYSTLLSTDRLVPLTIGAEIQVPTNNQPPLVSCSPNAQYGINDWSSIPCSVTDDITTNPLDFTNFLFDYYEGVGGLSPVIGTSNPLELTALVTWRSISNLDQNGDYIPTPVEACVTDGGVDALHNGALQGCTQFEVVVGRYGPPFGNMFTNNKTIGFNDRYATHIGGASATSFTLGTYNLPELGSVNLDITTSQAGWLSYVGFECNKNWNCSVVNNGTDANAVTSYSISATRLNSSTMSSIGDIDELVHLKFMTARVGIITYNVENVVMQDNTGAQITTPRVDTRFTLGVSN